MTGPALLVMFISAEAAALVVAVVLLVARGVRAVWRWSQSPVNRRWS